MALFSTVEGVVPSSNLTDLAVNDQLIRISENFIVQTYSSRADFLELILWREL